MMRVFFTTETRTVLHDYILVDDETEALYSDKHSIFQIACLGIDAEAETQFSWTTQELWIEIIHANSPQAKGHACPSLRLCSINATTTSALA